MSDEHFLIVPKEHIAHSLELNKEQEEELQQIKDLVVKEYLVGNRSMDYFVFERNMPFKFSKAAHMNIQVVGFPSTDFIDEKVKKLLDAYEARNKRVPKSGGVGIKFI